MPDNVQVLLGVLQSYAPNGDAQQACSELLWSAQREGLTVREQVLMLVNTLHDGLSYGNWPWV